MLLEKNSGYTEGNMLSKAGFKIGDEAVILGILRDKIYSNPIGTICREISCNSRDAHREFGCEDRPIEITLPTKFNSEIKFRDFGPGISPERIDTVYRQYGKSTKRDSNNQTGGFGLGAKTPFSYTNGFTVKTIIPDENGQNICRIYSASLGEDECGDIVLLSETPTNEERGTEVAVPVIYKDIQDFKASVKKYTEHWKVLPKIINNDNLYEDINAAVFLATDKWALLSNVGYYGSREIKVIVDGVPYDLDLNILSNIHEISNKAYYLHCRLYFNTGELDLSAGREELNYSEKTKREIISRLVLLFKDAEENFKNNLLRFSSYKEASAYARDFEKSTNIKLSNDLRWKNSKLYIPAHSNYNDRLLAFQDDNGRIYTYSNNYRNVLTKQIKYGVMFGKDVYYVVNDLGKTIDSDAVKNVFDECLKNNGTNITLQVFSSRDGDLNLSKKLFKDKFDLDIDDLDPLLLSNYKSSKTSTKKVKNKEKVTCHQWKHGYWNPVDIDLSEQEGYYIILENRKTVCKIGPSYNDIGKINCNILLRQLNLDKPVFGIKEKQIKKCGNKLISVEDIVKKEKEKLDKDAGTIHDAMYSQQNMSIYFDILSSIYPQHELNIKANQELKRLKKLNENIKKIRSINGALGIKAEKEKADKTVEKLNEELINKYPFIQYLDSWVCRNSSEAKKDLKFLFEERD